MKNITKFIENKVFDKKEHKTLLVKILKEVYSDSHLRKMLGFKGGTALYLFYDLPRLSVDLDFNLLDLRNKDRVFNEVEKILKNFGDLEEAREKRFTLFFLLSYKRGMRKIKIEISKRPSADSYEVKQYLGIPILVMKKENMAAGKLSALLTRKKFAARDLFDLWYILSRDWQIDEHSLKNQTHLSLKDALNKALNKIKSVHKKQLLQGVGELIDEKQKNWIKDKLKNELIFLIKLRLET